MAARRSGLKIFLIFSVCLGLDPNLSAYAAEPTDLSKSCGPNPIGAPCPGASSGVNLNPAAGNPVHLASGNKYLYALDLPAASESGGLAIERHYNALDPRTGVLGQGWQHGYATTLYVRGTRVNIIEADGTRHVFSCDVGGCAAAGSLSRHRKGNKICTKPGWQWQKEAALPYCFDVNGALQSIGLDITTGQNPPRRITLNRHPAGPFKGLIQQVRHANGDTLQWVYRETADGARLVHIDAAIGPALVDRITYEHLPATPTGRVHLASMRRPDGWGRFYLYEAQRQTAATESLTGMGFISFTTQKRWRTHTWRYDKTGRVVGLSWGEDVDAQAMTIHYAPPALDISDASARITNRGGNQITTVRTARGDTHFTFAPSRAGYALLDVTGVGCPGCAHPGLRADYNAQGQLTRFGAVSLAYQGAGKIRQITQAEQGWPGLSMRFDADAHRTQWRFEDTGTETQTRSPDGLTTTRRFADGGTWVRTHNPASGRTRVLMHRRSDSIQFDVKWHLNRPVDITHPNENESRRYDSTGRLTEKITRRSRVGTPGHYAALRDRYQHDDIGRVIAHELPEGGRLTYAWSAEGRLAAITWRSRAGHTRALLASDTQAGYRLANGLRVQGLMRKGHLQALSVDLPAGPVQRPAKPVWGQFLSYDAAGNIAQERWLTPQTQINRPSEITHLESYRYDTENRLSATPTTPYEWTPSGLNRAAPQRDRDRSGLLKRYGTRQLVYGADRRLKQVKTHQLVLARYGHNAWGERIWRQTEQSPEHHFFFDRQQVVAEARPNAEGQLRLYRRYVYAEGLPIALIDYDSPGGTAIHSLITDSIGAPWLATDDTTQVTWQAVLNPTGQARILQEKVTLPLRLPGQWYDVATGWHDNYLRTYDPAMGHYLEPDPLGPLPHTQAYGYAAQHPRRQVDPSGLLLFAFDGTQKNFASNTNIARFVSQYAGPVHYAAGPGNPDRFDLDAATASSAPALLLMQWERLIGALRDAPIAQHAIDIVGFSRGAALGRVFGNRIAAQLTNGRFSWADASGAMVSACVNLRFLGLFDTVKRFGILGMNDGDYDTRVAAQWQWVAHAVALHERRGQFPLNGIGDTGPTRHEAPFIGAHSDIGGGYLVDADAPEGNMPGRGSLAAVSLAWMRWQARLAGVPFEAAADAGPIGAELNGDSRATLHDERPPMARQRNTDRALQASGEAPSRTPQGRHPVYGRGARQEVEQFIERNADWLTAAGNAIGQVQMTGYVQWLRQRLGLILNQIKPRLSFHAIIRG